MNRNEAVAQLKRLRYVLQQNPTNLREYVWFGDCELREYSRNSKSVRVYCVEETVQGSGDYVIKQRWDR